MGLLSIFKSKSSSSNLDLQYKERNVHSKPLCMRKHCTESCLPGFNKYKIWADLLAGRCEIDYENLLLNLSKLPNEYRAAVYLKCISIDIEKESESLKIFFDISSFPKQDLQGSSSLKELSGTFNNKLSSPLKGTIHLNKETNNTDLHYNKENLQLLEEDLLKFDGEVIELIFEKARLLPNADEHIIFEIFKTFFLTYGVNKNFINIIIEFFNIPEMSFERVNLILNHLIERNGLLDCNEELFYVNNTLDDSNLSDSNKESILLPSNNKNILSMKDLDKNKKSEENLKKVQEKNSTTDFKIKRIDLNKKENNDSKNSNEEEINFEKKELSSVVDKIRNKKFIVSQIFKEIVGKDFELFIWLTDIALCTKMTYKEIIEYTIEYSRTSEIEDIIKILKAKANIKFFKISNKNNNRKISKNKIRFQGYFDFIIIQKELIKAQINIKENYEEKIKNLEEEILKLKKE